MMDEDLVIGSKSWNRMSKGLTQEGFREGAEAGKEENLQQGFNSGFKEGFSNSFPLGELKGAMKVLAFNKIEGSENFERVDTSDFKDCVICKTPDIESSGISSIIKEQSDLSKSILQSKLNDSVSSVLNKFNLNIPSESHKTPPSEVPSTSTSRIDESS